MDLEFQQFGDEDLGYWLALHKLPELGFLSKNVRLLVDRFRGPRVWKASRNDILGCDPDNFRPLIDEFIEKRSKIDPEALLKEVRAHSDIDFYPIADPRYPPALRDIYDPPLVLFIRGSVFELDFQHAIAVVGTRRPTRYGHQIAKDMAQGLAENGVLVVSGLALGIDSYAHWGAIEGGGRTLAVMASGVDLCYPSSNRRLCDAILDGHGAVVSEFFPGTKPDKWHFPARNRIISGISQCVVVVEAGESSGALITAKLADSQSREVFALPGRTDSPSSVGTLKLIFERKAHLIRDHKDLLKELNWVKTEYKQVTTVVELFGREKEVFNTLSIEPVHFDMLCQQLQMNVGELSATLTMLELAGLVQRQPGDWYARQPGSGIVGSPA